MQPHRKATAILLCIVLALAACGGKAYRVHPGAVNTFDSKAYDALLTWYGALEQSKTELAAGRIPGGSRTIINKTGAVYNSARAAWLAYRAAIRAGNATDAATAQQDFNRFQTEILSLVDQLTRLILSADVSAARPALAYTDSDPPEFVPAVERGNP